MKGGGVSLIETLSENMQFFFAGVPNAMNKLKPILLHMDNLLKLNLLIN